MKIKTLVDLNTGESFIPRTHSKAVIDDEGNSIDTALKHEIGRATTEEAKLSARITDHVEVVEGKLDLKANKSDVYTKGLVDEKIASVYKVIGSSTFEELPTEGNAIGDVYNITNDFTLNGVEYPFGTNVVWTEDGWDTLSGVFDTTELEGLVESVDTKVDEEIVRAKARELELDEKFDLYLPLSGGTLKGTLHAPNRVVLSNGAALLFTSLAYTTDKLLLPYRNKNYELCYLTNDSWNKIWHEGNDGEGSGLDADMLDGKHLSHIFTNYEWKQVSDANEPLFGVLYRGSSTTANLPNPNGQLVAFNAISGDYGGGQLFFYGNGNIASRISWNAEWSPWKTIAFTDSNITGNAATATKLATPVKLWGNNFDGSSDINGTLNNVGFIYFNDQGGDLVYKANSEILAFERGLSFKNADGTNSGYIGAYGEKGVLKYLFLGKNYTNTYLTVLPNGNVGIGTTDPQYKLDVNGSIQLALGSAVRAGNKSLIYVSNVNNGVWYGLDGTGDGITYYCGNKIILKTSGNNVMVVNEHGNVTIGSSDLAGSNNKLFVDGTAIISNNFFAKQNLFVDYKISSGDYVDWYGVSWSEDSSDPTCTRIGNMALHRSLPIQSAMKGYVIVSYSDNTVYDEMILPLNDIWTASEFNLTSNNLSDSFFTTPHNQIMVKIPEFWYIDEYDGSTKTHNLKISQTAKAGWCHHKEAYVGAYEGYNDSTRYRSTKGKIPTVSVSRTTLRPLARANGYEDEYKWNIYTYEEHRAICHLFLVEYATRNSQAAVNTTLTSDGFKQGGLGSGCTTGTVTINGVTTYSFIPTGTTDSLGNGSGQVAYTVTHTDADGNETTAVTRYANRYRGIENPFGHIWKHVDDIVNVYDSESGNKTVYKCNKPEHFATNKNAKYKALCAFPGGAKMQGWSKEIKATINCDFFKYSIGGSETTYWCDYNYDNDDTSEHCLLIGGNSVHGGWAGLFSFALGDGVGNSSVRIGSRLTYLPWAE